MNPLVISIIAFLVALYALYLIYLLSGKENARRAMEESARGLVRALIRRVSTLERQLGPADMRELGGMSVLERISDLVSWSHGLDSRLEKHDRAAGGFWRTGHGDVLRVRDISDGHLRNLIQGKFGSRDMQQRFKDEATCRGVDCDMSAAGDRMQRLPEERRIELLRKMVGPRHDVEGVDDDCQVTDQPLRSEDKDVLGDWDRDSPLDFPGPRWEIPEGGFPKWELPGEKI